jgi:hypothetical protein
MLCSPVGHARPVRVTHSPTKRPRGGPRAGRAHGSRHQLFTRAPGVGRVPIGNDDRVSRPRPWRPRRRVVAVTGLSLALLVASGCDSGGRDRAALDPATALRRLETMPAFTVRGSVARGTERGAVRGTYGARPQRALVRAPVDVGAGLARVEVRRIGDRAWIRRAVVLRAGIGTGPTLLALRAPGTAPYVAVARPDADPATRIVNAYDPAVLLRRVEDAHIRAIPASDDPTTRDGETSYTLRPTAREARQLGVRLLTVTATADGTPTRMAYMTATQVRVLYRIHATGHGPVVAAPPAGAVARPTTGSLPDATGPYTTVGSITAGTTPITIATAPGSDGWTCWKVTSTPAYHDITDPRPSGGVCTGPLEASGDPADHFAVPLDAVPPTPYDLVAFLVPSGSTGSARYADGSTRPLAPVGDLLVAAGSSGSPAVLVTISVPGAELVCGPGPVSGPGDLEGLTDAQVQSLPASPWNCSPAGS